MAERKNSPTNRLRDLDNPTAAFPIGALHGGGTRAARHAVEEDETERRQLPRIPIHSKYSDDDEDYESTTLPVAPEPDTFDLRLLVIGLLVMTGIAMIGAVIAAALVMM